MIILNLQHVLEPLKFDEWLNDYWGQKPFYNTQSKPEFSDLISIEDIHQSLKSAEFYETANVLLRSDSFDTMQCPQNYDEVVQGIDAGLTLQIRNLEKTLPQDSILLQLARTMESILLHPLDSITFFQSQPHSKPTAIHKDIGEIFSFQIAGKKQWKLAIEKNLSEKMCFENTDIQDWNTYRLEAGQCMYLPSYLPHQVKCVEEESVSVALVFKNIQHLSILAHLQEDLKLKSLLIRPLPPLGNTHLKNSAKEKMLLFKQQLIQSVENWDHDQFIDDLHDMLAEVIHKKPQ